MFLWCTYSNVVLAIFVPVQIIELEKVFSPPPNINFINVHIILYTKITGFIIIVIKWEISQD